MVHWNVQALAEALQTHRVSERERMRYLIAFLIIYPSDLLLLPMLGSTDTDTYWRFEYPMCLTATVLGILTCFRANQSGDGAGFVERFICLSWPVTVRLAATAGPVLALLAFILWIRLPVSAETEGSLAGLRLLLLAGLFLAYYLGIRAGLLRASRAVPEDSLRLPR